jgi:CBS domain-containing protein
MRAVNKSLFVPQNATIESANELIESNGVGAVAVVNQTGELVGFFRRGKLKRSRK